MAAARDSMIVCQVSDMHVRAGGKLAYGVVDTAAHLRRCIAHILKLKQRPDAVVMTGDLVDGGKPEEYALLREIIAPLAMPVYLIPGNHDEREALRAAFPDHAYLNQFPPFIQYAIEEHELRIVAIDTVGFISNLPPSLVASFRSTLEELEQADLLLHVVDGGHPRAREQLEVTEQVLRDRELGDKPRMTVLNKFDQVKGPLERNRAKLVAPGAMMISAFNPDDVVRFRDSILEHFRQNMEVWEILVPYAEGKVESMLYSYGSVEINRHMEKGTFYRLRIEKGWAQKLGLGRFRL